MRFIWLVVLTRTEKNSIEQKNSCTPRMFSGPISATCVEEIVSCGAFISILDCKRRRNDQDNGGYASDQLRD